MPLSAGFALVLFIAVAGICLMVAIGARRIGYLRDQPIQSHDHPSVSIIVTALNEADTIEPALRSLLSIDYAALEVIVINDRSTDATSAVLDRIAADHVALRVLHIESLPAGWLGKNHALHRGAELAKSDFLLFTDADAVFAPDAVSRAVSYCQARQVDHLTLLFDVVARTQLLRMMILSFAIGFMARFQPWKINESTERFVGVGGFNMVRTSAYRAVGGHAAIPMAVLDDLALGKSVKQGGHRQHVLFGADMVSVEWYRSTPDLAKGIEKNIFTAFDYRLAPLIAVSVVMSVTRIWPWIALFTSGGAVWWCSLATVLATLGLYADLLRVRGWSYRCLVFAPIVPLLELAMWWRGSLLTILRNGIVWRGTFYPLDEIRRAHAVEHKKRNPAE